MTNEMKNIIDQLKAQILKEYPHCVYANVRMENGCVKIDVSEEESFVRG